MENLLKKIFTLPIQIEIFKKSLPTLDRIYGRADLVEYNHQDVVRHLFIDGAAGTPMFRFDGNLNNQDPILSKLLLESSGFVPLLFLQPNEK